MNQLSEDLNVSQQEIVKEIKNMESKGIVDIYKNISDFEWEELEQLQDDEIKERYYNKSNKTQNEVIKEIINEFKVESLLDRMIFPQYNYKKENFDKEYMSTENYKDEIWKQIGNLNYSISNYGRIKNIQTNKLKKLKYNVYGMQVLLWQNSKSYTVTVSRIVAEMFIRHLEKDERAIHIDNNIRNNYYKNLKIVSK